MVLDKARKWINEINEALSRYLEVGDVEELREMMKYYPLAGGKRLRPLIALLVAECVGNRAKEAMPYAIALELTHNFTLVHDDIMDMDMYRRGRKTLHTAYSIPLAINAGDALFARAMELLTEIDLDMKRYKALLKEYTSMVRGIAEGQHLDMRFEERDYVSVNEYMVMIEKKTALMFKAAAKGGAIIGLGTEEQVKAMAEYGLSLGLSFQIWDDLLDIRSAQELLGKDVGSDIRNGKKTLLVIYALERMNAYDKRDFMKVFGNKEATDEDVLRAVEILEKYGAIDYAEEKAKMYADKARETLRMLRDCEEKKILEELVDYMVKRKY
ncbi:MAG: polyprenyl synthetase family protein [Thermoplasmata archaeon]|nr:MAG: polyprenyl synthetase family protein [Thermoplasmata archaeon]